MLIYYNAVIRFYLREERAGEESILDLFHRDGRTSPGPGRGSGDSSADCSDDYRVGGVKRSKVTKGLN